MLISYVGTLSAVLWVSQKAAPTEMTTENGQQIIKRLAIQECAMGNGVFRMRTQVVLPEFLPYSQAVYRCKTRALLFGLCRFDFSVSTNPDTATKPLQMSTVGTYRKRGSNR